MIGQRALHTRPRVACNAVPVPRGHSGLPGWRPHTYTPSSRAVHGDTHTLSRQPLVVRAMQGGRMPYPQERPPSQAAARGPPYMPMQPQQQQQLQPQQQVFLDLSQVLGKQVITRTTGRSLGTISGCWMDPSRATLVSFDLQESKKSNLLATPQRAGNIPLAALRQIGDVVLVHDEGGLYEQDLDGRMGFVDPVGLDVRTRAGDFLGKVRDLSFSPDTGVVSRFTYDEFGLATLPLSFLDCYSVSIEDVMSIGRGELLVYDDAKYRERKESNGLFAAIPSLLKSLGSGRSGGGGTPLALPAAGMSEAWRGGAGAGAGAGYLPADYSYEQWQQDLRRWEAETGMTYEQYLRNQGGRGAAAPGGARAALPARTSGSYTAQPGLATSSSSYNPAAAAAGAMGRPGGATPAAGARPGGPAPQQQQQQQQWAPAGARPAGDAWGAYATTQQPSAGWYGAAPAAGVQQPAYPQQQQQQRPGAGYGYQSPVPQQQQQQPQQQQSVGYQAAAMRPGPAQQQQQQPPANAWQQQQQPPAAGAGAAAAGSMRTAAQYPAAGGAAAAPVQRPLQQQQQQQPQQQQRVGYTQTAPAASTSGRPLGGYGQQQQQPAGGSLPQQQQQQQPLQGAGPASGYSSSSSGASGGSGRPLEDWIVREAAAGGSRQREAAGADASGAGTAAAAAAGGDAGGGGTGLVMSSGGDGLAPLPPLQSATAGGNVSA